LTFNQTGLGPPICADDIFKVGLAGDHHRSEAKKHQQQILINQGAHERGKPGSKFVAVLIQHVHGAQQVAWQDVNMFGSFEFSDEWAHLTNNCQ
jgi:hypothetical protein